MAVQLKVNTDTMQQMAQDLSSQVELVKSEFSEIMTVMTNTGIYWHGDAADADRKGFSSLQENVTALLTSLDTQPRKLCDIANIMLQAELSNVSSSEELINDEFV